MAVFTIETPTGTKLDIEAADEAAALAGAQQWHAENSAKKPSGIGATITDAAKSLDSGVAAGTAGILGLPGDVTNLAAKGIGAASDFVNDKLGLPKYEPPSTPGPVASALSKIPTSESMAKEIQNRYYGGAEPYKPQTTVGGYAHSVGEMLPGVAGGEGGLLAKGAQAVGAGLGSEGLGEYFKGTALEPYARFFGGVLGGVGTAAGSKAVEGARNVAGATSAANDIEKIIGGGSVKGSAVDRVAKNIADEELTAGAARSKLGDLGPNGMVLDLGHQLENRADFMAQHSGKAQNTIYKPVAERAEGIAPQINSVLDKHLGPSQDVVKMQNGIEEWSRQNVGPLYKNLEQKYPVVNDAKIQELAQRPAIQQAQKNAGTIAKDMGEQLGTTETKTLLSGPGYHIADDIEHAAQPSIRYWDFVKKSLDQRINGMMKGADESAAAQSTMAAVMQARRDLIRHLDDVTGGEYAQARKLAATKPAMEEALDLGRSIFGNKMLPEQLAEHLDGLSLGERRMVEIGVRREIEHRVGMPGDEGRKLRSLIGAPNNSAKLEHLLGPQANREIQNEVAAADQFQRVKNKIEGTRTATRTSGMNDTTAPKVNLGVTATGLLGAAPGAAVNYALEHGFANTRQDIARLLTTKGDKANQVVERLLQYNAQKAKNEAAPMSQQAAALVRALLSGTVARNVQ